MVKCGARLCRSARGVSACTPSSTMRVSRCYHRRMRIAPRTPNHANATASKNASCGVSFCPRQLTVSRFVACSYREHLQQQDCHGHVQQEHSLCDQHVCRAVWHWRRHQSGPEDLVAGYSQQSWAAAVSKQREQPDRREIADDWRYYCGGQLRSWRGELWYACGEGSNSFVFYPRRQAAAPHRPGKPAWCRRQRRRLAGSLAAGSTSELGGISSRLTGTCSCSYYYGL